VSAPCCPVASVCGGCPLLLVSAAAARARREDRLREALRAQIGDDAAAMPLKWVSLPQPDGYRRRIRMRITDDARIGFFNPMKYLDCCVLTPGLRTTLHRVIDRAPQYRSALNALQHLEVREPDTHGTAAVYLAKRAPDTALSPDVRLALGELLDGMQWAVAGEPDPVPSQRLTLPMTWQWVPISSFLQVNAAVNALLVEDLLQASERRGHASFCDLYSGSGNFALPLLARGLRGCGVELDPVAAAAAERAAVAQGFEGFATCAGDAGASAEAFAAARMTFDLVVLDPPRAGMKCGLESLATIARGHVAYCSCNPLTLARDLAKLAKLGFAIESITIYDMFKYTEQIECFAWLRAPNCR
jgi:23S rRNA (uracil1939-C5)-methyltransferase